MFLGGLVGPLGGAGGSSSSSAAGLLASSALRYSRTARLGASPWFQLWAWLPGTPLARFASAFHAGVSSEAFAANQALAHAASQHRLKDVAECSLWRNRPCRFFEKVEWS